MVRIANRDADMSVKRLEAFQGSNLRGENYPMCYVVFSYEEPIYMYDRLLNIWLENTTKFSVTTSKHVSLAHPGCTTQEINSGKMWEHFNKLKRIKRNEVEN